MGLGEGSTCSYYEHTEECTDVEGCTFGAAVRRVLNSDRVHTPGKDDKLEGMLLLFVMAGAAEPRMVTDTCSALSEVAQVTVHDWLDFRFRNSFGLFLFLHK